MKVIEAFKKSCTFLLFIATLFQPIRSQESSLCSYGGVDLDSNYFPLVHLYSKQRDKLNCDNKPIDNQVDKKFIDYENEVKDEIKKIEQVPECKFLDPFIKELREEIERIKKEDEKVYEKLNEVKKEKESEIQIVFPALAYTSLMCTESKVSQDVRAYWRFLHDINEARPGEGRVSIQKDGENAENCYNVIAQGETGLKEFYINTSMAKDKKIFLNFDTYFIPDQLIVYSDQNKILFDSGCKGIKGEKEIELPSQGENSKIKLEVKHNCEEGYDSSAWSLQVQCMRSKSECSDEVAVLKHRLKQYLNQVPGVLDNIWIKGICYEDLYGELLSKFLKEEGLLKNESLKECRDMSGCGDPSANPDTEGNSEDPNVSGDIDDNENSSNDQRVPSALIIEYGKTTEHCLKKVDKETSLFQLVSRRYCLSAYERLFEERQSDFRQ
jgi:hypothetical protein